MTRSSTVLVSLALATVGALLSCKASKAEEESPADAREPRPNILIFYADDHAQNAVSAYGSGLNSTPNIDRIGREGVRFANSFVGNSICAPARATVLTGRLSHTNGVRTNADTLDPALTTFPELLQGAGYQTALIGKWHLKSDPEGFDHWEVLNGQGPYYNPELLSAAGSERVTGYTTEIITERALDWLTSERDGEHPFLLMVQHKAPHRRWLPGPNELTLFEGVDVLEPPTLFDDYATRASGAAKNAMSVAHDLDEQDLKFKKPRGLTDEQLAIWDVTYGPRNAAFHAAALEGDALVRWKYQRYIKDYLRCIAAVDKGVGRILDWLDGAGLTEDTIVVYTSDQGFYLGEHGWYDKRWMYEESLRTPMLVRWPERVAPGGVVREMVQNVDLAPTLLEVAGLRPPSGTHGRSFLPLLRGQHPADWRDAIYYRYYESPSEHVVPRHLGIRTERFKLIRYEELDEWELFDLKADPYELRNVASDPHYDDVRADLEVELDALMASVGDRLQD